MSAVHDATVPRGALIAAGALIGFSILVAAAGRHGLLGDHAPIPSPAAPVRTIDLGFTDQANGGVLVRNAGTGATVTVIPPNSGGFLRGVLRGLTRERMMHGLSRAPAFRLSQFVGGHLEIEDLADGRRIDLDAFGPTNRDAFMVLLPPRRPA